MRTKQEELEVEQFYRDCNKILSQQSFNDWLESECYRVYLETKPARSKHCKYCMLLYHGTECLANKKQRSKGHLCWRAMNKMLLARSGLGGQKN